MDVFIEKDATFKISIINNDSEIGYKEYKNLNINNRVTNLTDINISDGSFLDSNVRITPIFSNNAAINSVKYTITADNVSYEKTISDNNWIVNMDAFDIIITDNATVKLTVAYTQAETDHTFEVAYSDIKINNSPILLKKINLKHSDSINIDSVIEPIFNNPSSINTITYEFIKEIDGDDIKQSKQLSNISSNDDIKLEVNTMEDFGFDKAIINIIVSYTHHSVDKTLNFCYKNMSINNYATSEQIDSVNIRNIELDEQKQTEIDLLDEQKEFFTKKANEYYDIEKSVSYLTTQYNHYHAGHSNIMKALYPSYRILIYNILSNPI